MTRPLPAGGGPHFPRARTPRGKWGLPIHVLLWLLSLGLLARLTLFIRQRSLSDFAVIDHYALIQALLVLGSLLAIMVSGRIDRLWRTIATRASGLFLLYYLFGALSALWSPAPAYSFYRAVEAFSQIAAIHVALSYAPNWVAAERRMLVVVLTSMMFGMAAIVRLYGYRFGAISWHDNQFTVPAAIAVTYACGELAMGRRRNRRLLLLSAGLGLCGVMLGTSSASILAVLCGLTVGLRRIIFRGKYLVPLFWIIGCALLLVGLKPLGNIIFYGKTPEQIGQLSGRMQLWQGYLDDFTARPLFGNGFAISARLASHRQTTNTHNSALSVLLGTGLAGLALALGFSGRLLREGRRALRRARPGATGAAAALIAGLLNSMSVACLGETWMLSSFSFVSVLAFFSLFVVAPPPAALRRPKIILRRKFHCRFPPRCG